MNNLVFNNTAEELKTSIYGQKRSDGTTVPIQLDDNNALIVSGTVTVGQITAPITIGNTSLTVAGTVTVANPITISQITAPVTIGNTSLTVAGSVTVANPITVSQITAPVTIGNTSLTVFINGNAFTSSVATAATGLTPTVLFNNLDISTVKVATFLLYNTSGVAATVSLQISPTTSNTYYITDSVVGNITLLGNSSAIIVVGRFAQYARLICSSLTAGSITAYYNGQA